MMALTRAFLRGMSLTDEQVSAIIEAHAESIDALKAQRDSYKEAADRLEEVQKELNELKESKGDGWQEKYDAEHSAFEAYKTEQADALNKVTAEFEQYKNAQAEKETEANKREAYKRLLADAGISEKRIAAILKVTDLNDYSLNEGGTFDNADELTESIKSEWGEFIAETSVVAAPVPTPPASSGNTGLTKESIMQISDRAERRKAIAENPALFGKE